MNLYRLYITIVFGVLFVGIFACSNNDSEITPELTISLETLTVSNTQNTKTIYVNSNVDWSVESSEAWCNISPVSGSAGYTAVTINVTENELYEEREASITVSGGDLYKSISLHQQKAYALLVETNEVSISNEGGEIEVKLQMSESFDVSVNCDWITQKTLKSLKDSVETFVVEANTTSIHEVVR